MFLYTYVYIITLILKGKYLFSILTMNKRLALTSINIKIKHLQYQVSLIITLKIKFDI